MLFLLMILLLAGAAQATEYADGNLPLAPAPGVVVANYSTPPVVTEVLTVSNALRAKHGAPPLAWSPAVAKAAQAFIDTCPTGHSGNSAYGENLGFGYATWTDVVNAWYAEQAQYDYTKPGFGFDTGHFTALVWRATTQVGCASKVCPKWTTYVCNYDPPGNVDGGFQNNVSP